ncbi:putative receptor-like protein kinase At3g47110 isoform X2 [Mercurialis annua]|uniref:putative receptor-like protein kinase At3g47110 isoform X2 n=1 Tax=Mercurialis annua TaxID=3986 RepID=UPI002160C04A|nr:putative receptor-like protein kinase At3g47110 isoform X2 [Mercurialis annua]
MNIMEGEIPEELGSLSKMEAFGANNNHLTGSIPFSFGNLSSLGMIFLQTNFLDGSIPESLGRLKNLTDFWVGVNMFSGDIPLSLFNLSSLINFNVAVNQIQGVLPSNIGTTLPNIQHFSTSANHFTGEVPSLKNLNRLRHFSISKNFLGNSLSFLCSLKNATNLQSLIINFNKFEGVLPECIGNLSITLSVLAVDNNRIFGSIPAGIGNLINLQRLDMWNNQLSGTVDVIGKLQKLVYSQLQENQFSGEIPNSLGNLTKLTFINLRKNNLHGSIPSSLGNCQSLVQLSLSSNKLNGSITPQIFLILSLFLLDLSENRFTGVLPSEIGNLKNLGTLGVYANMLSGEIPTALGSCLSLEIVSMQGNSFQGPIPSSLRFLGGLGHLDISRNNLSGKIPEFLATFNSLYSLNLSFNDFEGMVPIEGAFKNLSATSLVGNTKLCGGMPEFHLPACKLKRSSRLLVIIIACSVAGFLSAVLMIALLCFVRLRKRGHSSTSSSFPNSLLQASYQDLRDATDGFSSSKLIGAGSFGSVYKGILRESRAVIAVKVVNLQHHKAAKSFMAECEALRNIRHRNLVKVLTVCSSIDPQGNDFKALVYEFMGNGSLDEWLHPLPRADNPPKSLTLLQRLNISIDIASALEYLHHHCETPLVHCDLKPSNILLNDELDGHISDFGIAKFISDSFSSHQSSTIGLRGTIGYAPPEYGLGAEVSKQGDVYSYGVLLLEMFTGKRPTHNMFKDGLSLHEFAKSAFPDRVVDISDPILLQEIDESMRRASNSPSSSSTQHNKVAECLISVIGIGVASSIEAPGERMDIKDVTMKLSSIRKKLLATRPT